MIGRFALALLLVISIDEVTRPRLIKATATATWADSAGFVLSKGGHAATIVVSDSDWAGVRRAANDLQSDIRRVSGARPRLTSQLAAIAVIVGTLGKSPLIDRLVGDGKLDSAGLSGRWESYVRQVIERPLPNVDRALVIAGSDKRGTIYGTMRHRLFPAGRMKSSGESITRSTSGSSSYSFASKATISGRRCGAAPLRTTTR